MPHPTSVLTSARNKIRNSFLLAGLLVVFSFPLFGQPTGPAAYALLFYNTENLFDTTDDSLKLDDEFLPEGSRHWTRTRLQDKLNNLAKVILAANGFRQPDLIALCEVENRKVLELLTETTPLKTFGYRVIHKDSPDERGIDVALLFRASRVQPLEYHYLPLVNERGDVQTTREILHASFAIGADTLRVMVNHWPSRYGGQADSEPGRIDAARVLKNAVSEVLARNRHARIVVVGDFNDTPENESIKRKLGAVAPGNRGETGQLVNLSAAWTGGTLKHEQSWAVFDQVMVSNGLLGQKGLSCQVADASIVRLPFLFEDDPTWGGKRLFRTYRGYEYTGGFSDHLPVLLRLSLHPYD